MKVKIIDFLLEMGKICDEYNNGSCFKCPFNYEGETFHGCMKDDMSNPKNAKMIKDITLNAWRSVKQNEQSI